MSSRKYKTDIMKVSRIIPKKEYDLMDEDDKKQALKDNIRNKVRRKWNSYVRGEISYSEYHLYEFKENGFTEDERYVKIHKQIVKEGNLEPNAFFDELHKQYPDIRAEWETK